MWEPSTHALDQSSPPAACNSASRMRCSRSKTPACCHRSRRLQQVCPEPNPAPGAVVARLCRCGARTGCPADTAGPPPAEVPVIALARAAAAARSASTSRHPQSTGEYSHPPERPNRRIGHARPGHLNKIVLRALGVFLLRQSLTVVLVAHSVLLHVRYSLPLYPAISEFSDRGTDDDGKCHHSPCRRSELYRH